MTSAPGDHRAAGRCGHAFDLVERCSPPYAKWVGSSMIRLPRAGAAAESLHQAVRAENWRAREDGLVYALRMLHGL